MESMAVAPGFARAIAGTGPVFAAFLVPHILAGLTAISSGALVMVSRKGTERHVRAGTAYFWVITVLAATAAGLTAIREVSEFAMAPQRRASRTCRRPRGPEMGANVFRRRACEHAAP